MAGQQQELVIDWARLVIDLNRAGVTDQMIANEIGRARTLVVGWRAGNYDDLRYHDGERLVAMWRAHMVPPIPMRPKFQA